MQVMGLLPKGLTCNSIIGTTILYVSNKFSNMISYGTLKLNLMLLYDKITYDIDGSSISFLF
jgi:hypothetical protein